MPYYEILMQNILKINMFCVMWAFEHFLMEFRKLLSIFRQFWKKICMCFKAIGQFFISGPCQPQLVLSPLILSFPGSSPPTIVVSIHRVVKIPGITTEITEERLSSFLPGVIRVPQPPLDQGQTWKLLAQHLNNKIWLIGCNCCYQFSVFDCSGYNGRVDKRGLLYWRNISHIVLNKMATMNL